jgi:hypothetical protein
VVIQLDREFPIIFYAEVIMSHVEAALNTYTLALRVVEGDKKGTQCLGV